MRASLSLFALIASPAIAQVAPPPGQEVLTEIATEYYAGKYGVSVAEAKRQIAEIKRVGREMERAGMGNAPGRSVEGAGIAIDRRNGFSVSVRYGGPKGPAIQALEARGIKTVAAAKSRKQYRDEVDALATKLGVAKSSYAFVYDALENKGVLLIKGSAASVGALPALPEGVSVEFRNELITLTANIYGSDSIAEGGTVGFVAARGTVRGVTGPAHTHNGQASFTVNGDIQSIQVDQFGPYQDIVWGTKNTSAYGAWIRVTAAGNWKTVGLVSDFFSATPYCKYGRTSKITCGVYSRVYEGPWAGGSYSWFPLVKGDVQMALEGDSGGPVFEDYGTKVAAIGTTVGYTGTGGTELVVYPITRLADIGLTVVTQ